MTLRKKTSLTVVNEPLTIYIRLRDTRGPVKCLKKRGVCHFN